MSDHDQQEGADDHGKIDFPAESDPGAVIHAAHGKLNKRAAGPETVGNAVAVLIGKNQHLLIDMQNIAQRLENRHNDDCLAASGHNQEVEKGNKNKDNQQSQNGAFVFQKNGHAVYNCIHNACLIHQDNDSLGHSHGKCGGKNTNCSFAEQIASFAGAEPENNGQQKAHDQIDGRNLQKRPAQTYTAVSLYDDNSQEYQEPQNTPYIHLFCALFGVTAVL